MGMDALEDYVQSHNGTIAIRRILIANNGLGAAKAIRSIRRWAYQTFRDSRIIKLVGMATPEDLLANAEYVQLADNIAKVPGGPNTNNYKNVEVIVKTALQLQADAVWPGWGHASENPRLPERLREHNICFLGPPPSSMQAVGDKICANILAQSVGVNVIPWSGSGLTTEDTTISPEIFNKAVVHTVEEARQKAEVIGFPLMIKASEGGGGKGIRKVEAMDELISGYKQVMIEVPGSPVFLQRLSVNSRHLEVQVVMDLYGNGISLFSRDCSVQRRHQKIIEEGPVTVAPQAIAKELESGAVRLCKKVGYASAGTVEYLYNGVEYTFLEVNPRLQVEHSVTEAITNINIPAVQLQVAMGIPLDCMPDIRRFYGFSPHDLSPIDFTTLSPLPPLGHCIAARITAENPDDGFKPSSGTIDDLQYRATPGVFANFSVGSRGCVHQFSDSQFGHLFALAETREDANRLLVATLSELSIRGEISNNVKYLISLLESDEFRTDCHDTTWLDGLIAKSHRVKKSISDHTIVVIGAIVSMREIVKKRTTEIVSSLERGVVPPSTLADFSEQDVELIYEGTKYQMTVKLGGADTFQVFVKTVLVTCQVTLLGGGLLVQIGDHTHLAYKENSKVGMKLLIDGWSCFYPPDFDPSNMCSNSAGKLVEYLVSDNEHVKEGQPYCNIEAMKMIMPLLAGASGRISYVLNPGAAIDVGDRIATLALDDPASVKTALPFQGTFSTFELPTDHSLQTLFQQFIRADEGVKLILDGYSPCDDPLDQVFSLLCDRSLPSSLLRHALQETQGLIPEDCYKSIATDIDELEHIMKAVESSDDEDEDEAVGSAVLSIQGALSSLTSSWRMKFESIAKAIENLESGVSHYQAQILIQYIEQYLSIEEIFSSNARLEDAMLTLRQTFIGNLNECVAYAFSHANLGAKNELMFRIMDKLVDLELHSYQRTREVLLRVAGLDKMQLPGYSKLSQRAKSVIVREDEKNQDIHRTSNTPQGSPSVLQRMDSIKIEDKIGGVHLKVPLSRGISMDVKRNKARRSSDSSLHLAEIQAAVDSVQLPSADIKSMPAGTIRWTDLFQPHSDDSLQAILKYCEMFRLEPNVVQRDKILQVYVADGFFNILLVPDVQSCITILSKADTYGIEHSKITSFLLFFKSSLKFNESEMKSSLQAQLESRKTDSGECLLSNNMHMFVTIIFGDDTPASRTCYRASQVAADAVESMDSLAEVEAVLAYHCELYRLSEFNLTCLGVKASSASKDSTVASESYAMCTLLAEEKTDNKSVFAKDRRVFCRSVMYRKDLFFPPSIGRRSMPSPVSASHDTIALGSPRAKNKQVSKWFQEEESVECERTMANIFHRLELNVLEQKTACNHIFINISDGNDGDFPKADTYLRQILTKYANELYNLKVSCVEIKVGTGRIIATNEKNYAFKVSYEDFEEPPPYQILDKTERKRMIAQNLNSTYVYDFIDLFKEKATKILESFAEAQIVQKYGDTIDTSMIRVSTHPFQATELVYDRATSSLVKREREQGMNDAGMVAWHCSLRSPEYPKGREFVLVANDITFKSGSFSPIEDVIYEKAVERAIHRRIPLIYLSANSGARIGLDDKVKQAFQIAWIDPADPTKGIKYLYLLPEDYAQLKDRVRAVETVDQGQTHWRLTDIMGGLGVECLQGSGQIATVTSKGYQEVFMLTYVTARSVGIGAYVARLSQRIIQQEEAPLILTGFSALNELLGRPVYTSNLQIGGPKIMGSNGISNIVVNDDSEGVEAILRWLSFVPLRIGDPLPFTDDGDNLQRIPTVVPDRNAHDPRPVLENFFDSGSFIESLAHWGRTVVAGRARLGGLPIGVIAVETRMVEKTLPPDPAFEDSQQQTIQQAGQVWFPDSAFKTAQSIRDMNKEELPLMIFANFRGFAGGVRDMYGEILKFGAYIVDALREYNQPIFVYIPHEGELRGGAWVVIDSTINPEQMEMYAAEECRAGVLEPEGIVDIKFRKRDLLKAIDRIIPSHHHHSKTGGKHSKEQLLPIFRQAAIKFAALHDTPQVMLEKGVIKKIVPWKQARAFFGKRLRERLCRAQLKKLCLEAYPSISASRIERISQELSGALAYISHGTGPIDLRNQPEVVAILEKLRAESVSEQLKSLVALDKSAVLETIPKLSID